MQDREFEKAQTGMQAANKRTSIDSKVEGKIKHRIK
jgi:hypothetical protein